MTEIDEVAAQIYAKYQLAWPLNRTQAATLAHLSLGDQGQNIIAAVAECLFNYNAKRDDQQESDQAFHRQQLFARACKALGLNEDENSWFDIVGQIEKLANPGPTAPFTAQLFDALAASSPGSTLVYDEGHELRGTDEIRYPSGDGVLIELSDGAQHTFMDQGLLIDSGGHCPVTDDEGRQFYFVIQIARPIRASDLEKADGTGN